MASRAKVLVVDDDSNILSAFRDLLMQERCEMIEASSLQEAREKIPKHEIALLVAEVRLKRDWDPKFFAEAKKLHPTLKVIAITGYTEHISKKDAAASGADYFFAKPIELQKFREALRACVSTNKNG